LFLQKSNVTDKCHFPQPAKAAPDYFFRQSLQSDHRTFIDEAVGA